MMEATDFAKRDDPAGLPEREMRSCAVIVREVACQDSAEVRLVKTEAMGQTLLPDRADEPFHEGVGRGSGRS